MYKLLFGVVDADVPVLFIANNVDKWTQPYLRTAVRYWCP